MLFNAHYSLKASTLVITLGTMAEGKRKLWTEESMEAATRSVLDENRSLREASRLYNIPFETLRRRVHGYVMPGCRPGPATVLTEEEEDQLASYLTQMSDMSGLKKSGIFPLNPGEVTDRQLAPLKLFQQQSTKSSQDVCSEIPTSTSKDPLFST